VSCRCPDQNKRAHRGRAVGIENHRLRRARIVDTCERVNLRHSKPLSHGVVLGDHAALDP
jgi:hypothetical protein